jgi:hypothetical protein
MIRTSGMDRNSMTARLSRDVRGGVKQSRVVVMETVNNRGGSDHHVRS